MKRILVLFAALTMASLSTPSPAQPLSSRGVLMNCPDVAAAQACTALTGQFLADRTAGKRRDGQVINLVIAIAEATQTLRVTGAACLNAAEGLRILAAGITAGEQGLQISDIADSLCANTRTASIDAGRSAGSTDGDGSSRSTPRADGGMPIVVSTPPTCTINCRSDALPASSDGLGSNDAANSPNQNALDHADEHATDNTNGQIGQPHGQGQGEGQGQGLGQGESQNQGQGQQKQDAASAAAESPTPSTPSETKGKSDDKGSEEPKGKPDK